MPRRLAALSLVLLFGTVALRLYLLRRRGTRGLHFGETHRSDRLLPPLVLAYVYTVFAGAFGLPLPAVARHTLLRSDALAWAGVALCYAGVAFLLLSLAAFGTSFRVGIDAERPGALVTGGVFGVSRNPIYVGFALVLLGQALVSPTWPLVLALVAGWGLLHRQVRREEEFLEAHYGEAYRAYCRRVRRYL